MFKSYYADIVGWRPQFPVLTLLSGLSLRSLQGSVLNFPASDAAWGCHLFLPNRKEEELKNFSGEFWESVCFPDIKGRYFLVSSLSLSPDVNVDTMLGATAAVVGL